jgi:hypothetical protein
MAVMAECWACGKSLDPAWRFCIACGVPVERDELPIAVHSTAEPTLGPLAITGIVLASIAALGLVVTIIALVVPS